jgi:BASS family bile acid:Na+ symporter
MIINITRLFPVWAILFSIIAYFNPLPFLQLEKAIIPLLSIIMFGMGITLSYKNFYHIFQKPKVIITGIVLQYVIMPLSAFLISLLLRFPDQLTCGMVLVGSSAGGTASNVICYLANGNVALSITLTMFSTFLAVAATPLLTWLYLGQSVYVPVGNMMLNIIQIIIIPVLAGIIVNSLLGEKVKKIKKLFPLLSVTAIVFIIAIIVALNHTKLTQLTAILVLAVVSHNAFGLVSGYWITKLLGYDEQTSRTIAIEVGMQNSGLSVALAIKFFSGIAALPGAIFSIWHNISGSFLAAYWGSRNK